MDTFFQSTANIYKKYRLSKIIFNKMPSATEKCVMHVKWHQKEETFGKVNVSSCMFLISLISE